MYIVLTFPSGGVSGSGAVVVYGSVTPASCDCLKSYVQNCIPFGSCAVSLVEESLTGVLKDCILPILPISGCAKAAIGGSFPPGSFQDAVISVIDIAMSCVVSSICPVCGPIWDLVKYVVYNLQNFADRNVNDS